MNLDTGKEEVLPCDDSWNGKLVQPSCKHSLWWERVERVVLNFSLKRSSSGQTPVFAQGVQI